MYSFRFKSPLKDIENFSSFYPLFLHSKEVMNSIFQLDFFIEDVNDEAPVFSSASYSKTIGDDSPIGLPVLDLKASDKDSAALTSLSYSLSSTDKFKVNSKTGQVTVASRLDAADGKKIDLTASVTDGKATATVSAA